MASSRPSSDSGVTKECVEAIQTLLSDPEFGTSCLTDADLCKTLSDGEVLCSILSELSGGRADLDGGRATSFYSLNSQILAKKNVRFFLKRCSNEYDLTDEELFEPDDLLEMKSPERVVRSVNILLQRRIQTRDKFRKSGNLANVVAEICEHEKSLVDKLHQLTLFRKELLGILSEWSEELVSIVFRHTEQLYNVHKEFHTKLMALHSQGCEHFCQKLNAVFEEMAPKLEIYLQYFSHLPTAHAEMEAAFQQCPELRNQLDSLQKAICDPNSFDNLYDSPIRQVPNYLLLFERLSRTAAKEAPLDAQQSVDKALKRLKDLLDGANTYKRQAEQTSATEEVLKGVTELPADLSEPAKIGLHLADGPCKLRYSYSTKDRKENREFGYCILTTKMLLLASRVAKKQPLAYWTSVPMVSSLKFNKRDTASVEIVRDSGDIVRLDEGKAGHGADTWIRLLEEAKAACFPPGWNSNGHSFQLSSSGPGVVCSACEQLLHGSVLQGYLCQLCGRRLHLGCLSTSGRVACGPTSAAAGEDAGVAPQLPSRRLPSLTSGRGGGFYHAGLDRSGAVALLAGRQPGTFLVRPKGGNTSGQQRVLSIRTSETSEPVHIEILEQAGRCALGSANRRWFPSIEELLDYYSKVNMSVHFSQIDCKLTRGLPPAAT